MKKNIKLPVFLAIVIMINMLTIHYDHSYAYLTSHDEIMVYKPEKGKSISGWIIISDNMGPAIKEEPKVVKKPKDYTPAGNINNKNIVYYETQYYKTREITYQYYRDSLPVGKKIVKKTKILNHTQYSYSIE